MWFHIDPRSPIPVYRQVVDGIREGIARGILVPGERLPSVRELASDLMINHNTIAKAYQELEREHVIEVIRGRGTFIAPTGTAIAEHQAKGLPQMEARMKQLLIDGYYLNMTVEDLLDLFREVAKKWDQERGRDPGL